MIDPTQFTFGVVTKLSGNEGELVLDGATLTFRLSDQLTEAEIAHYLWEHETQAYDVPEIGETLIFFRDTTDTVRWTWPQLILRSSAGKAVLDQAQYDQPVQYPGLYMAYLRFATSEDEGVIKMFGSAEFPRKAAYVGFQLDAFLGKFPGLPMEICRYDADGSRVAYVGQHHAEAIVG